MLFANGNLSLLKPTKTTMTTELPPQLPQSRRRPAEANLETALTAWQRLGLPVGAVVVMRDGTVRIEAPVDRPAEPAQDGRKPEPWT
jgi:hypothetical protein